MTSNPRDQPITITVGELELLIRANVNQALAEQAQLQTKANAVAAKIDAQIKTKAAEGSQPNAKDK